MDTPLKYRLSLGFFKSKQNQYAKLLLTGDVMRHRHQVNEGYIFHLSDWDYK